MILDDDTLRATLDIATFSWLLAWAVKGALNLLSPKRDSVSYLFITHFVICGLPLLLDHIAGRPDLHLWHGFNIAAEDGPTALVYCLYVAGSPLIWWYFGRSRNHVRSTNRDSGAAASLRHLSWKGKTVLHVVLVSPLVAWYLAPNPGAYYEYADVMRGNFNSEDLAYLPLLAALTLMSAVAGSALLFSQRRLKLTCCYVLPFAFLVAWLNGKRLIVLIVVVLFGNALWSRGALTRRALAVLGPILAAGFWFFSASYQSEMRGVTTLDSAKWYDSVRLDFGRDSITRMTLYAELYPDTGPILEYRMQSVLFDLTMFVPRTIWPDKPWPYSVYATAAAFRMPVRNLGWGITTNWLEEAVANFGWPGLIIGPMLLAGICRIGDATQDNLVRLVTILLSSMLLALQLSAFAPLAGIWLFAVFGGRLARRAPSKRLVSLSGIQVQGLQNVPPDRWRFQPAMSLQESRLIASRGIPGSAAPQASWRGVR